MITNSIYKAVLITCSFFLVSIFSFNSSVVMSAEPKPVSKKHPLKLEVGQKALGFEAYSASGSVSTLKEIRGKIVLLTFLSLKNCEFENAIQKIEGIRKNFAKHPNFMIVAIFTDEVKDFMEYCEKRGSSFHSDSKMWILDHITLRKENSRKAFLFGLDEVEEGMSPRSFLISPDQKFIAVDIPQNDLEKTIKKALIK